jgi:dUTP pyrophosphatase
MKKHKVLYTKVHPDAKTPTKAYEGDAGFDLYAVKDTIINVGIPTIVDVGLRIALPEGYYAEIHTRSKHGLRGMRVHLGIIDSGYRGDLSPIMISQRQELIRKGEKVAQLIIKEIEKAEFVEVDRLPDSERGTKGFGSSDKKLEK